METASLLPRNISPCWEQGACQAEITIQQSFGGKKEAGYITANMKKDPPGTIPAILHLNTQAFSLSTLSTLSPEISHCSLRSLKSPALSWAWH